MKLLLKKERELQENLMIHALWEYLLTEKSSTTPQVFLIQQIWVTNPQEVHVWEEDGGIQNHN